ncbi:hypothetical protein PM082_013888 [Marasmius tenuissimus]|nr:hypothetical protein PM082_013888 [Marasmius tenuissimus]
MSLEEFNTRLASNDPFHQLELDALVARTLSCKEEGFWFPDGRVILVGETAFKVHLSIVFGEIDALKDWVNEMVNPKIPVGHPTHPLPGTEAYPMVLESGGIIRSEHVLNWLKNTFTKSHESYRKQTFDEHHLVHLLHFAHFWVVDHAVRFAKEKLYGLVAGKEASIRLEFARRFKFGDWIEDALEHYIDITSTPQLKDIRRQDIDRMGWDAYEIVVRTREAGYKRRIELALTTVPSMGMSNTSLEQVGCSVERHRSCRQAWEHGWRFEVAPRLLDSSHPLGLRHGITSFIRMQAEAALPSVYSRIHPRCLSIALNELYWGPEESQYGWKEIREKAVEHVKGVYGCWQGNDDAINGTTEEIPSSTTSETVVE